MSCCFCKRFSTIRILCIQISHLARPSLLPLKTAATFVSLKLSLLTRRVNSSKDPDHRDVVRTEFANVLKLDFKAHSGVVKVFLYPTRPAFLLTVSFCVHVMSVQTFNRSEAQAMLGDCDFTE